MTISDKEVCKEWLRSISSVSYTHLLDMGLALDSSLTPSNSTWWKPVTASQNNQGEALKQSLERYITFHTVENLGAYGIDEITAFNIYCEARGNGSYSIYFLFA